MIGFKRTGIYVVPVPDECVIDEKLPAVRRCPLTVDVSISRLQGADEIPGVSLFPEIRIDVDVPDCGGLDRRTTDDDRRFEAGGYQTVSGHLLPALLKDDVLDRWLGYRNNFDVPVNWFFGFFGHTILTISLIVKLKSPAPPPITVQARVRSGKPIPPVKFL